MTTLIQLAHLGIASSPRSDVIKTRFTISLISLEILIRGLFQYDWSLLRYEHKGRKQKLRSYKDEGK